MLHQSWQTILKQLERRFTAETYHNRIEMIRQHAGDEQHQALVEITPEKVKTSILKLISQDDEHCFVPLHLIDNKYQEMSKKTSML